MPESNQSEGCYLVTGAASGIGLAVTTLLAQQGCSIAAVDRNLTGLYELQQKHPSIDFFEKDLLQDESVDNLITEVVRKSGPIRGFVHAAGFDRMEMLHLTKRETVETLFKLHAEVPLLLSGKMSKKNNYASDASCVFISSLSAHEGAIGHAAYAAAKGALEGFIPAAAAELARKKIRMNAVILGVVQTPMSAGWISNLDQDGQEKLAHSYPLGLGQVDDVASMIGFLLSDDAKWITGQKFILDGGHLIRG